MEEGETHEESDSSALTDMVDFETASEASEEVLPAPKRRKHTPDSPYESLKDGHDDIDDVRAGVASLSSDIDEAEPPSLVSPLSSPGLITAEEDFQYGECSEDRWLELCKEGFSEELQILIQRRNDEYAGKFN